jgi:hypothetical protein
MNTVCRLESLLLLLLLLWLYIHFLDPIYTVGRTPWTGDQPVTRSLLYTGQHKYRINAHNTDISALSGIQTHDPSVRASEDSSCQDRTATVIGYLALNS